MSVTRIISPAVPTLSLSDTGTRALALMEENHLSHLPVVEDEQYIALLQETELLDWETPESPLSGAPFLSFKPAVMAGSHSYDAIRLLNQLNLSALPVIDGEQKYYGTVTREGLLKFITENGSLNGTGGIIVLEMLPHNYSLYQIARICENEDITIVNSQMFTTSMGMMEVTLKTNRTNLDALVASFERHDYKVLEVYGDPKSVEDMMGKYNLLMNYINM